MKSQIVSFLLITLIISLSSCKNEPEVRRQATETAVTQVAEENANRSVAIGKISSIENDKIKLDNGKEFDLPSTDDKETCVIFFVQTAESVAGKTALSEVGLAMAGYLAQVLGQVGIAQIYCEKNSGAMQTALQVSRANESELNYFQEELASAMLGVIVGNFKGKRVLVTGSPTALTSMLNEVSGESRYSVASNEFDNMYIATVKEVGNAEILHVKY